MTNMNQIVTRIVHLADCKYEYLCTEQFGFITTRAL